MNAASKGTVRIGDRIIGQNHPAFVVAEAGVNHNGSVVEALRLVDVAADAKADAVKFQMFRASELTTASTPAAKYQETNSSSRLQQAILSRLELSFEDFQKIKTKCDEREILFLVTPFGIGEVDAIVQLGAPAIKIASTDVTNLVLLEAAAKGRLPLILSTGASTAAEIHEALEFLQRIGAEDRTVFLHCVSAYPTPMEALNLRAIQRLSRLTMRPTGLSDHTTSIETGAWAVAAGARVLEKHITLDRRGEGPDHAMSLAPDEFGEYVSKVRDVEKALGSGRLGFQVIENDVREVARRSVVAQRAIPRGKVITADLLTVKRPGTGIPPRDLLRVVGHMAKVDIACDTTLSWEMID